MLVERSRGETGILDLLLKVMKQELEVHERASLSQTNCSPIPSSSPCRDNYPFKSLPSTAVLVSSSDTIPSCTYCRQSHASNSCKTVSNVRAWKEIRRESGRCYVCLRTNHLSRDCRSGVKCLNGNSRHHVSICTSHKSQAGTEREQMERASAEDQSQPDNSPMALFVTSKTPILLQTAQAIIYKKESGS